MYHLCARLLAIHEALGNDVGREKLVALSEFLEDDAVGEALATDSDSLEHAVAAQLVQNQRRVDLSGLKISRQHRC